MLAHSCFVDYFTQAKYQMFNSHMSTYNILLIWVRKKKLKKVVATTMVEQRTVSLF